MTGARGGQARRGALALAGALACTAAPPVETTTDAPGDATTTGTSTGTSSSTGVDTSTGPTGADDTSTGEPVTPPYTCDDAPGDPVEVSVGYVHVCARRGCATQCWGIDQDRQLGHARAGWAECYSCAEDPGCCVGDDEAPAAWGDVQVGAPVRQIDAGSSYTCALLEGGDVRCWGRNSLGQLGLGHAVSTPGGSLPWQRPLVKLGGEAVQISAGSAHTCAVLAGGGLRCWGNGYGGALGYGDRENVGDDELPGAVGDVDVGGPVVQVSAGTWHTCAVLVGGGVRCWGTNYTGELGHGDLEDIGDDETPASAGDVPVGAPVVQVAAGRGRTCALTETGGVRCWGGFPTGVPNALGMVCAACDDDPTCCVGDDETPADVGDLKLGGAATQVAVGGNHACALLASGAPICWGVAEYGGLGLGLGLGSMCHGCEPLDAPCCAGDDEDPAALGPVALGAEAVAISVGDQATCAVLADGRIRCWGLRHVGLLGDGAAPLSCVSACDQPDCCIGDDETPAGHADVAAFAP